MAPVFHGSRLVSPTFRRILIGLSLVHLAGFAMFWGLQLRAAQGFVLADGVNPVGGDFVNLWTAGRLVLEGLADEIYVPARFEELQRQRIGAFIGHRLWAYPPHSLALAVPFAIPGYFVSLALWSLLGLAVLACGALRIGFSRQMTAILVLSPASLHCVHWGQTGNLACGLLLLALSQRGARDGLAIGATAALTIKPQFGLLLPPLWLLARQWGLVAGVGAAVLLVLAGALVIGGWEPWHAYLFETLPELSRLERYGTGAFVAMIPSVFMALRISGFGGDLAAGLHMAVAGALLVLCLWFFRAEGRPQARHAMVLVGTAAITPYLHIYDLTLALAGAMMIARLDAGESDAGSDMGERAVIASWVLPYLTLSLNAAGVPLAPLVLLGLPLLLVWSAARSHPI